MTPIQQAIDALEGFLNGGSSLGASHPHLSCYFHFDDDQWAKARSALAALRSPASMDMEGMARKFLAEVYHSGRIGGHEDTVEGRYSDYRAKDLEDRVDDEYIHRFVAHVEAQRQATSEAKPASFTEVATLALDMTEGIWSRVKGIEQYELTNLAERCINKGMELRRRHVSTNNTEANGN